MCRLNSAAAFLLCRLILVLTLTSADREGAAVVAGRGIRITLTEHLGEDGLEHLSHVLVGLGGDLEVLAAVVLGDARALLGADFPGVFQVDLVAHYDLADVLLGVLSQTIHPALHALARVLVGDIEAHEHTLAILVETLSHGLEALLASRVPNLDVHLLVGALGRPLVVDKVDAERHEVGLLELAALEHLEQRCFADAAVADHDHIVLGLLLCHNFLSY